MTEIQEPQEIPEGEANEAPKEENSPKGEVITLNSFKQLEILFERTEGKIPLKFVSPIVDVHGAVLVQKHVVFRQSMFVHLQNFSMRPDDKIDFELGDLLRAALIEQVRKNLFVCLDRNRFHIAETMLAQTGPHILRLALTILRDKDVLQLLVPLVLDNDPIIPHLGETALIAAAIADFLCNAYPLLNRSKSVKTALVAGLLHDIALADDADFLSKDIDNPEENGHAEASRNIAQNLSKIVDASISQVILRHHRSDTPWRNNDEAELPSEEALAEEAVAFADYLFAQTRKMHKSDQKMSQAEAAFYSIGRAFGAGMFHRRIQRVIEQMKPTFARVMNYGFNISAVEASCLFKNSAVAYPAPRCTQVLCQHRIDRCQHFDPQYKISILQPLRGVIRPGIELQPGSYPKCKLAEKLPKEYQPAAE